MSKQVLAAVGLTAALAGIVGGVAYAQSAPVTHEAPMVVVPAAQVVTPSPAASATAIPTTTAPAPVATTAAPKVVAPKVVAPAPVESAAPAPAPVKQTVRKAATVSAPAAEPAPEPAPRETGAVVTNNDGSTTIQMKPGQQPPIIPARPAPEPPAPSN